jgi:hypothetical protein
MTLDSFRQTSAEAAAAVVPVAMLIPMAAAASRRRTSVHACSEDIKRTKSLGSLRPCRFQ